MLWNEIPQDLRYALESANKGALFQEASRLQSVHAARIKRCKDVFGIIIDLPGLFDRLARAGGVYQFFALSPGGYPKHDAERINRTVRRMFQASVSYLLASVDDLDGVVPSQERPFLLMTHWERESEPAPGEAIQTFIPLGLGASASPTVFLTDDAVKAILEGYAPLRMPEPVAEPPALPLEPGAGLLAPAVSTGWNPILVRPVTPLERPAPRLIALAWAWTRGFFLPRQKETVRASEKVSPEFLEALDGVLMARAREAVAGLVAGQVGSLQSVVDARAAAASKLEAEIEAHREILGAIYAGMQIGKAVAGIAIAAAATILTGGLATAALGEGAVATAAGAVASEGVTSAITGESFDLLGGGLGLIGAGFTDLGIEIPKVTGLVPELRPVSELTAGFTDFTAEGVGSRALGISKEDLIAEMGLPEQLETDLLTDLRSQSIFSSFGGGFSSFLSDPASAGAGLFSSEGGFMGFFDSISSSLSTIVSNTEQQIQTALESEAAQLVGSILGVNSAEAAAPAPVGAVAAATSGAAQTYIPTGPQAVAEKSAGTALLIGAGLLCLVIFSQRRR